jgi:hypothetical protein
MRDYIIITVFSLGVLWALDAYEYDGRYSNGIWRQTVQEGQDFSDQVQRRINRAFSGY